MDRHSHIWLLEKIMDRLLNCLETKTLNNQFSCNATILALKTSNPKPLFLHMQTIKSKKKEEKKKRQKQNKTQVQWSRAFLLYRGHKASMCTQYSWQTSWRFYGTTCAPMKVLRNVIASQKMKLLQTGESLLCQHSLGKKRKKRILKGKILKKCWLKTILF